ncbi:unnamed protein product, partial [Ilex paraguariensis]
RSLLPPPPPPTSQPTVSDRSISPPPLPPPTTTQPPSSPMRPDHTADTFTLFCSTLLAVVGVSNQTTLFICYVLIFRK